MPSDSIGSPANAPGQEQRILEWLLAEPGGLTQLQAFQHLAVQRLAAMVHRLKGRGHNIRTELVEMPTRYGPAIVAQYHLVHLAPRASEPLPAGLQARADQLHPLDRTPAGHQAGLFTDLEPPRASGAFCRTCNDTGTQATAGGGSMPCGNLECFERRYAARGKRSAA